MKKYIFLCFIILSFNLKAQPVQTNKMDWFGDAKLGIFIHWGIYSVNGISESWSFFNNYLNHEAYMKQLNGFTAAQYNPQQWVQLIKESGARYAVITTKHHDGVALWNTKMPGAVSTMNKSTAKRDLITPFVSELKKSGLKTGLYFSLPDWSFPDYDVFTREQKRYTLKEQPERWNTFLTYYQGQLQELSTQFKPDLLWFDGDWEHSSAEWQTDKVRKMLFSQNPALIINSRLDAHGDYETPEQGIPIVSPSSPYWELCYTMNDSWGYQPYDRHYKSANMIIQTLVDCISMGGNLLLDIGPKADGTIPAEQVAILKSLGRWTSKHREAIYGTRSGIAKGHFNGKTALSKDEKTLYLYLDGRRPQGTLLKGIASEIANTDVIGYAGNITYTPLSGNDYLITIPDAAYDKDITVIRVRLKSPIRLHDPVVKAIDFTAALRQSSEPLVLTLDHISSSLSNGANPFQNSSLTPDGMGFSPDVKPLNTAVKQWVIKHAEALYKTGKGIPEGHFEGSTALSADKKTLYLFVEGQPNGPVAIKGLKNQISRIRIVGEGTMLEHSIFNKLYWSQVPGIVYIDIPKDRLDQHLTVIAILLDGEAALYREKVSAIESNE